MLVSKSWCEETAKDIIWEFENLLCNNDVKINNMNPEENEFESEDSYINKKDYENLKEKVNKLKISIEYFDDVINSEVPNRMILQMLIDKIYINRDKMVKFELKTDIKKMI